MSGYRSGPGPGRMVTKLNVAGQALYAPVTATTGAGVTLGSWAQVVASTASERYLTGITVRDATGNLDTRDLPLLVDVGTGGAGSESAVASFSVGGGVIGAGAGSISGWVTAHATLPIPVRLGSGVRLAVRVAKSDTNGATISPYVTVHYTVLANVEGN